MKNIFLAVLAFVLGFGAFTAYDYIRVKQSVQTTLSTVSQTTTQPTPAPTFALIPPSQAVSGTLTVLSGHAEKYSRGETEYQEASTGAQILSGESIATKDKSTAVATVSGIVTAKLDAVSELVFANVFPSDFVLQQKTGKIDYLVTTPISVRALHTLVTVDSGEIIITIIDTDMSIIVKTGSVKFAFVDLDNNTKIWTLKTGQRANIDDASREVFLVQTR